MVYKRSTRLGPDLLNTDDGYLCYLLPLEDYLDTDKGLRLCISTWQRLDDNAMPARAKASGAYLNSSLAKTEALQNGFDEAIMLNRSGQVAEGSAENLFLVRDGVLITPDLTADILEGITRAAVLDIAKGLGIAVCERPVARTELYRADECFLVGTGCQVSWVANIDHRMVGSGQCGPITASIREAYDTAIYGRDASRTHWLTPIE